jgi:predicted metal-dependent phosphoesterase TrpH
VPGESVYIDLHCHTSASFDSLASPAAVARTAAGRGLTYLAITDHDRLDGAFAARDAAPESLTVLVGQEIRTREGDLIGLFLDTPIARDLPAAEAVAAVRAQGGLVGIPHPFDRFRGSLLRDGATHLLDLARSVDWIEAWNARIIIGDGNTRAAELAVAAGVPGIAVSDAHTTTEIGVAYTILDGDPSTPDGLRAALGGRRDLITGRASAYVRLATPLAKLVKAGRR